jgi:hypothetical protein
MRFRRIDIMGSETGSPTPLFGLLVFTVKTSLPAEPISVRPICAGAVPVALFGVVVCRAIDPELATAHRGLLKSH